jgi:hypothetical protein
LPKEAPKPAGLKGNSGGKVEAEAAPAAQA